MIDRPDYELIALEREQRKLKASKGRAVTISLFLLAVASFLTAYFMNGVTARVTKKLPPRGGIIGPITVHRPNTVFDVRVHKTVPMMRWAYVGGNVLDAEQEYLFGFGDELWAERGRDSDGRWVERKYSYDVNITLPRAGKYYLEAEVQVGFRQKDKYPVTITVARKKGSWVPLAWLGALALLGAIVANQITTRRS